MSDVMMTLTHLPSIDLADNLTSDSGAGLGELPLYLAGGVPRISKQVTDKLEAEMYMVVEQTDWSEQIFYFHHHY